jgi:hypothetical protein
MKVFAEVLNHEMPLSTAACLSARFPVVTPAGTVSLAPGRKLRYVDGGYFENSATATLLDLLRELVAACEAEPHEPKDPQSPRLRDVEFFVIQTVYVAGPASDPAAEFHSFGDPASPVRALLNTRQARGKLSQDALARFLATPNDGRLHPKSLMFVSSGQGVSVPLGWSLSAAASKSLTAQLPSRLRGTNAPNAALGQFIGKVLSTSAINTTR